MTSVADRIAKAARDLEHSADAFMHVEIAEQLTAIAQDARTLDAENAKMLAVVEAAKKIKFAPYPAHGTGYVTILVDNEDSRAFGKAVRALSTLTNGGEGNG